MSPTNSSYRAAIAAVTLLLSAPVVLAKPTIVKKPIGNLPSSEVRVSKNELKELHEKAVKGDAESQYQLALLLNKDSGYITNAEVAYQWFLKAAGKSHLKAIEYILMVARQANCPPSLSKNTFNEIRAFAKGYFAGTHQFFAEQQS